MKRLIFKTMLRIIFPYIFFAGLWIILSYRILDNLINDSAERMQLYIYKGWAFVLITGLLLAFLLYGELKKRAEAYTELHKSEEHIRRNQALLLAVTEGTSDAVYVKDLQSRYLMANSVTCSFLGQTRDKVIGKDDTGFFSPEDAREIMTGDRRILESCETLTFEECLTIKGQIHCFLTTKGPVRDPKGNTIGVFGIARNVTEQKQIEQALRESERKYRELVEHANSIILHWSYDGRVTFLNEFGQRFFGYSAEEILGRHVIGTIVPLTDSVGRDMTKLIDQISADPVAFEQNVNENIRRDGERVWVAWTNRIVRNPQGQISEILSIGTNITELKRAEEAIRELNISLERRVTERTTELAIARDRAEEADRLKSAFLANMSHELRTPLNSIIGFTGIILQGLTGPLNAEQQKQLEMVRASARHLLALINDVLDISKIEAGQMEVSSQSFNLRSSIEKVAGIVKPLAEKKGLSLHLQLAPGIDSWVSDPRRVEQVLLNLLNNAIKFTEQGAITLTAKIVHNALHTPDSAIHISVIDTGIGIKEEDLNKLFQPFRQIEVGLSRQHEGTGLGLAICRRLTELLGGEIHAASDWGKGSIFTIMLPMKESGKQ
jgi:PAS domain S-box-containing protein